MTESDKERFATDIINLGFDLAEESIKNISTGFLTFRTKNILPEEKKDYLIENLRECSISFAEIVEQNKIPQDGFNIGLIFNYFLDKTIEIYYKQYNDLDLNTVNFDLCEIFDEYEIDVPANIRITLRNNTFKIVSLTKSLWNYMDKSRIFEMKFSEWLSIYLYTASLIGFKFAEEIDFNDSGETF